MDGVGGGCDRRVELPVKVLAVLRVLCGSLADGARGKDADLGNAPCLTRFPARGRPGPSELVLG